MTVSVSPACDTGRHLDCAACDCTCHPGTTQYQPQGEPWIPGDAELAELVRRFEQANTPAARAAHWRREMRRLLPRRTRLRLWRQKQLTTAAMWFLDHGHERACVTLWRLSGLWT